MRQDNHTTPAPAPRPAETPNPLWAINVGMAVFFVVAAAIVAVI